MTTRIEELKAEIARNPFFPSRFLRDYKELVALLEAEIARKDAVLKLAEGHLAEMLNDKKWHPIGHCPVLDAVRAALTEGKSE